METSSLTYIIAEAGVNHNGSLDLAKKLIDKAKESGADAVKFQTFKSENIVTSDAKQAEYQEENTGIKESQYAMLKRLELTYSDFRELKTYCDEKGITFLSTPHSSKQDVDLIAELCPLIKVGSGDLTNIPFLKYIQSKGLPIILSTGMATLEEVREAVKAVTPSELSILHCTTNYPAPLNQVNLKAIETLSKEFKCPIGYSDHTKGIDVPIAAVLMGAKIIEKHFTLDNDMPGPDHKASLNPADFKAMVDGIRKGVIIDIPEEILGDGIKKPYPSELEVAKIARKSIVANIDIYKGEEFKEETLAIKRPGIGIEPKHFYEILGKKAKRDIKKDTLLKWEDII